MGGAVSAGKDNDELIDNLVEADYIKTPLVQQIFRAVDRKDYYCDDHKDNAYRDMAWRHGNLHLSAPCVYSEVMESLKLGKGLSFLNLGSGTGYLNTMAGLVLGPTGMNHGVEIYQDVVDFAYKRLHEFVEKSHALDQFEFCEPRFVVGNCLLLDSSCQQYDRVYCGAACPEEHERYMKHLVKIGGILVMPLNDKLLQITRTSDSAWEVVKVLSVSFAPLILPSDKESLEFVKLPDMCPNSLQELCRSSIRTVLRLKIDEQYPHLKNMRYNRNDRLRNKKQVRRIVIPIFEESDIGSNNSRSQSEEEEEDHDSDYSPEYTIGPRIPSRMSALLEHFMRRSTEIHELMVSSSNRNENTNEQFKERLDKDHKSRGATEKEEQMETDEDDFKGLEDDLDELESNVKVLESDAANVLDSDVVKALDSDIAKVLDADVEKILESDAAKEQESDSAKELESDSAKELESDAVCSASFVSISKENVNVSKELEDGTLDLSVFEKKPSKHLKVKRKRRLSDEAQGAATSSNQPAQPQRSKFKRRAATVIWKRIPPDEPMSDSDKDEKMGEQENSTEQENEETYTMLMKKKIIALPLPLVLQRYINLSRELN